MKVKVCGMKYPDTITQVAHLQPDYLGFIFYEKSARYFTEILPEIPNTIQKVGVFVDADLDTILEQITLHQLDLIQLHGQESADFCKALKAASKVELIKVFSILDRFDFGLLAPYEGLVDYFLFDTKGQLPGGNGVTFNWTVLQQYPSETPYFLSGGIGPEHLEQLRAFTKSPASKQCHALDVNSKFELEPGLKDPQRLSTFINTIRSF